MAGTLPPGPAYNVIGTARVFTLPVNSGSSAKDITIALRTWQDPTIAGTRNSILDGPAYVGASDAVSNQFAATKAANLLATGGEYTIDLICLIICAAAFLLFCLTRERFYFWFACSLVLDVGFMVADLLSEHQAWGFLFLHVHQRSYRRAQRHSLGALHRRYAESRQMEAHHHADSVADCLSAIDRPRPEFHHQRQVG